MTVVLCGLIDGRPREEVLDPEWEPMQQAREIAPFHTEIGELVDGCFRRKQSPEIVGSGYVVKSLEAGGDGTIHEAVSGLIERGEPASIPLGIIPSGTGNDVARHLGVDSPLDAAQRIVVGRTGPFDVARVETAGQVDYCVTLIGWAGVADINRKAERLRMLGPPRYAVATLWQILFPKRRHAKLILDDQVVEDDFMLIVACNTIYSGSEMRLAPRAEMDDGKLDVVILRNASRWQMFRLFAKVFDGYHVDMPCVEHHQVRSLSILSDHREPLDLDGEIKGLRQCRSR